MSVLQTILSNLGVIICNPASGGGSMLRLSEVSEVLKILSTAEDDDLDACLDIIGDPAAEFQGIGPREWEALRTMGTEPEEDPVEEEPTKTDESPPPDGPASTPEVPGGDDSSDDSQDDTTSPGADENVGPV